MLSAELKAACGVGRAGLGAGSAVFGDRFIEWRRVLGAESRQAAGKCPLEGLKAIKFARKVKKGF